MKEQAEHIKREFLEELSQAGDLQHLDQVRIKFLSRSGRIAKLFDALKNVTDAEKPALGKMLNELRQDIQAQFDERKSTLEADTAPQKIPFDATLPGGRFRAEQSTPLHR